MIDEQTAIQNYADLVDKIVVSYNRSVILGFITTHSFQILNESMEQLQTLFDTIISIFEEIQKESNSSAANTEHINSILEGVFNGNKKLQKEIHERVSEIDAAALNAQNTASLFEVLKERTTDVKAMLAGIQDVSVRTGILAINASIEAARAGKAGDSFRIIANEVRSLSNQTGDFAKSIEAKLAELQSSVNDINENMSLFISLFSKFQHSFNAILNNFDKNSVVLNEAEKSLTEITSFIKEQDISIREGFKSLKNIDEFLGETVAVLSVVQTSHSHLETLLQKI